MKKIVIIDFDMQFIDTARIVFDGLTLALNVTKGKNSPKIKLDDVEEVINLKLEEIIASIAKKYDCNLSNPSILKMVKLHCEDYFSYRGILSDGLQEFLQECEKRQVPVYVLTNKPINAVKKCIDTFAKFLVKDVIEYEDATEEIETIKNILKKEETRIEETIFVSSNDFGNNGITHYDYSKKYCGDYIVSNMLDLVDVLEDKPLSHPLVSCKLLFIINSDSFKNYYDELLSIINKDFLSYRFVKNDVVITLNQIKINCYQNIPKSMYLDRIVLDLLDMFAEKKECIKELNKKYNTNNLLDVSIHIVNSKVNPSISLNKKTRQLLDDLDIDLDYDLFIN